MPSYRIHRMKDTPREQFRWAAHTGGLAIVKPKDYEDGSIIEAANPYRAWKALLSESQPLRPGDLLALSNESGEAIALYIAKYIGFEPAQWFAPPNNADSSLPSVNVPEAAAASQVSVS